MSDFFHTIGYDRAKTQYSLSSGREIDLNSFHRIEPEKLQSPNAKTHFKTQIGWRRLMDKIVGVFDAEKRKLKKDKTLKDVHRGRLFYFSCQALKRQQLNKKMTLTISG